MIKEKFNTGWKYWKNKDSFALVWNVPEHAKEVELPHDAMVLEEAYAESPNGGSTGYRDGDVYTYVKSFEVPMSAVNETIILQFEAIYMNALVYVNGHLAGKNPFGYSTINVELDRYLKYGEENEIRVEVRSGAMTNSRWYSGSGIYRDVYLVRTNRMHIKLDGVKVKTESIDDEYAVINVTSELCNKTIKTSNFLIKTTILDSDSKAVTIDETHISLFTNTSKSVEQRIIVDNPNLWSDETPNLYKCITELYDKESEELLSIDKSVVVFGIRTLNLDARNGLRVNGKSVKLRGACIHHDSGLLGAATYFDSKYRQVKKLKEAGFNAIRMSHQPMSEAMLKACDILGVYVMDELSDMWTRCKSNYDYGLYFDEWWEYDLTSMVNKDYNHPSVIMYSLGNEIPEVANNTGVDVSAMLNKRLKELDNTRYSLVSINGVFASGDRVDEIVRDVVADLKTEGKVEGNVNNFMQLMDAHLDKIVVHNVITENLENACATTDIAGYNYMTARYEKDGKDYPNRVIVGSETYPPEIARNWGIIKDAKHVIGDFTWTGWDYIGEAGVGVPAYQWGEGGFGAKFPAQLAYCGDFDITGNRRPLSYFREIVFGLRKAPYIAVQNPYKYGEHLIKTPWVLSDAISSWDYDAIDKPIIVEVYSPGEEVELLLNGESIGKEKAGESVGFITRFETTYKPGKLEAVCYEGGTEIGRHTIATSKGSKKINLVAESVEFEANSDNHDLLFINVELTDHNGILSQSDDRVITIEGCGNAEVIGFGSGNPKPDYNFNGNITKTFLGRATIILRKLNEDKVTFKVKEDSETSDISVVEIVI